MPNNYGENVDNNVASSTSSGGGYQAIEPTTVEKDESLQEALNGSNLADQDDRELDLYATEWGGMERGAVEKPSTQEGNWLNTVPDIYREKASSWGNQQGILKITPKTQRQMFTYTTVSYIAANQREPKVQMFPISDVNVQPHQISFDFYDTTEGRIGVSNATEKHMVVECDVYLTDLIYGYWNHGENDANDFNRMNWSEDLKSKFWNLIEAGDYDKTLEDFRDLEYTKEFADFRNSFLQQHLGWVCLFSSHTFGIFQGVLTDISYTISSGETFAKWHLKFEEALFLKGAYSTNGIKDTGEVDSEGDTENSGDSTNQEPITE